MENKLNFGLKLTLEELALRRVAGNVWNESDILASIVNYISMKPSKRDYIKVWQDTVEVKVKDKIMELVITKPLKEQMILLVKPMGLDTLKWIKYFKRVFKKLQSSFHVCILEQLCRTDKGIIDYQKTSEKIVHLQVLTVIERYQLASIFCLVDCIPALWEEVPDCFKIAFCSKRYYTQVRKIGLDFYWAYISKGNESKLHKICGRSYNTFAFQSSACRGNKAAAEYFLKKLTPAEQEFYVYKSFRNVIKSHYHSQWLNESRIKNTSDILCYLLTFLKPEQQMKILKKYPCEILISFLDWPWQDIFLQIADIVWTFIPESIYDKLLSELNNKVENSGYYFPKFFQDFFLRSPINFKKHFASNLARTFFSQFLNAEDTETIKVVFRSMDKETRMKLVSSWNFFGLIADLMAKDKWNLIGLCLREATLSEEDREKLKEIFFILPPVLSGAEIPLRVWMRPQREQFSQFLDRIYSSSLKKKNSDGEFSNKAKKVCIEEEKNVLSKI